MWAWNPGPFRKTLVMPGEMVPLAGIPTSRATPAWEPMAMAAAVTVAEVDQVHEPDGLDPERVITPGIFVNRIVRSV